MPPKSEVQDANPRSMFMDDTDRKNKKKDNQDVFAHEKLRSCRPPLPR